MNPEIQRLFAAALDLPEGARGAFVESQEADPAVRREVLSLLMHDEGAEPFFAEAIQREASALVSSLDLGAGARIAQYRIVSVLGRGGMGAVYLAERADGCFEQRVALKVIQSQEPAAFLLKRFQQERRILAVLSHPNIARLLDGGQTPDGSPYFVMEYVDGESLDQFCDRSQLPVRGRLELFLKVCDAVQYAHQNLIVHRDLKPANILVTAGGEPKLLDFGIAKVLDPAQMGNLQASTRLLTPEYASPEQIRGDPITTATDIYSLGAALYHLLSGGPPHAVAQSSPLHAAQAIAEADVAPIDGLPADLNAILRQALHKDAARRYRTAAELARDITRFLEGRPVLAAPDSIGYRARKFLRRNWMMAAAVAAVITALTAGAGVALWQARRAERRFADVRRLANTFLFDFEDSIHNVSGATRARLLVVNTANEYLNRLAAEAGGDRQLRRELADAYKKLGDVQGYLTGGNVGQFQQAAASYRKGLALRDALGDERSSDPKVRASYLDNLAALMIVERFAGDPAAASRLRPKAIQLADRWLRSNAPDADLLTAAALVYDDLSHAQRLREEFGPAAANARKNLELLTEAYELDSTNIARLKMLASGHVGAGYVELDAGRYAAAIDQFSQGNRLLDQPLAAQPKDAALRRLRLVLLEKIGNATFDLRRKEKGRVSDALPFFQEAYRIGNDLAAEDPANEGVQLDLAGLCQLYGSTLQMAGRAAKGLPLLERGIEIYTRQWKNVPLDTNVAFNLAVTRVWTSDTRRDLHDLSGALEESKKAAEVWDRLLELRPGTFRYLHQKADNLNTMGNLLVLRGDTAGARECFRAGLEIAEKLPKQDASFSTSVVINELRASERKLTSSRLSGR
jgi:tetratricopeptide (TPR) repeat protein/predicted Ser/Thr protein kinase